MKQWVNLSAFALRTKPGHKQLTLFKEREVQITHNKTIKLDTSSKYWFQRNLIRKGTINTNDTISVGNWTHLSELAVLLFPCGIAYVDKWIIPQGKWNNELTQALSLLTISLVTSN